MNFDAILGELCELESQLVGSPGPSPRGLPPPPFMMDHTHSQLGHTHNMADHSHHINHELDALPSDISGSVSGSLAHRAPHHHRRPVGELDYFRTHYPGDLGGYSDAMLDIQDTDSAFSESASLPSSESFTSMVTVSSSADMAGHGDISNMGSASTLTSNTTICEVSSEYFEHRCKVFG